MDPLLGKTGIDTEYEASLLRQAPVFRRVAPVSHAFDEQYEPDDIDRAQDLSLTNTLLGYGEVIRIATEYQGFVQKRLPSDRILKSGDNIVGWMEQMGGTLEAEEWLHGILEIIKVRAIHADAGLREQFLIEANKPVAEIYESEQRSIKNWMALLGLEENDGHPVHEPEVDTKGLAAVAGLHRQVGDLGLIHINRVEDMLEVLELVEQECVSPEATIQDGVSYLATFLYSVSPSAALAQVKAIRQKRVGELQLLLKAEKQVNLKRITALHEHQDQSFRIRNSYEANLLNPLMEMEDGVSTAMDGLANILMESAEDANESSGQGQAALLQLFKVEREWLGRLFSKATELMDSAQYAQILAELIINPAKDVQDIEMRLTR